MSDKNPCPFCGDYSEYLRFLDLCAERANELWRENEVKTLVGLNETMDFVQVVRCRDCKFADWDIFAWWCKRDKYLFEIGELKGEHGERSHLDGFCAWGERRQP